MPSGFYILLNYFLRVDGVVIRMNGTRYHFEKEKKYILKEFTSREAKFDNIKHVSPIESLSKSVFKFFHFLNTDSAIGVHSSGRNRETFIH